MRFYGSKWRIAGWIIKHFPPHNCYVEPYGGGGAVLLQKPRSHIEVYNDKDGDVVNFFRVMREHPNELISLIELTPWARTEWEISQQNHPDPIESARRFYVRAWQSIAGPTAKWRTGWRRQKMITNENGKKGMTPAPISFMQTSHLYQVADRLRGVQIECDDALNVIERFDSSETLFYLDPPYPASTRGRWSKTAYSHEMTDEQHGELARAVKNLDGLVMISGYHCDLYDELFGSWQRYDKQTRTQRASMAIESLWLSPRLVSAWKNMLPLFHDLQTEKAQ